MEKRNSLFVLIALSALLALAFYLGRRKAGGNTLQPVAVKVDTVIIRDTVRVPVPEPVVSEVIKYVPLTDTVMISDTVYIPILQKVYTATDYKAWVSGYQAALDSIEIYPKTVTVTRTIPPRRWGLGVTGGYGVGKDGLSPFVGVGVYYRIW